MVEMFLICPVQFVEIIKCIQLLSAWNVASAGAQLKFTFYFILIDSYIMGTYAWWLLYCTAQV